MITNHYIRTSMNVADYLDHLIDFHIMTLLD